MISPGAVPPPLFMLQLTSPHRSPTMPTATVKDRLFDALVDQIAPQLFRERQQCLNDSTWDGTKYWLSTEGIGEELREDDLYETWDNLEYSEQQGMLADALDNYHTGYADSMSADQ